MDESALHSKNNQNLTLESKLLQSGPGKIYRQITSFKLGVSVVFDCFVQSRWVKDIFNIATMANSTT